MCCVSPHSRSNLLQMGDGMNRVRMQYAYTGRLKGTTQSELVELYSNSFNAEDGESMFL